MYYYYLISSNINSFVAKRAMFVRAARPPSNRPGGSPAVCPGGHSSRLLAGRSSRQRGGHKHQKASVCLPVDRRATWDPASGVRSR